MGIDATTKFEEELDETNSTDIVQVSNVNLNELRKNVSEIKNLQIINEYGILVIALEKKSKQQIQQTAELLHKQLELSSFKFIVFVDEFVDVNDTSMITWIASGNIDPKRDAIVLKANEKTFSKIYIDATRKSLKKDGFKRNWPNVVVSSDETIKLIDNKWDNLGLGKFISSPSLKYKKLNSNLGAIAEE